MRNKIDLEFREMFGSGDEDSPLVDCDVPDLFSKTVADCEFSIDRAALTEQTAQFNKAITEHYKKIAATVVSPEAQVTTDPTLLQKRWNVHPKAGYREFFRSRLAKGISAEVALQEWLATFPHHNPDCESLMREVAAEFA